MHNAAVELRSLLLNSSVRCLGLSRQEIARLVGLDGANVDGLDEELTLAQAAKAQLLFEILATLSGKLEPEALPDVVRRRAQVYGGRSMLEVISDGEHGWLLEQLRSSFDYSTST